jgi:hypothetical protein
LVQLNKDRGIENKGKGGEIFPFSFVKLYFFGDKVAFQAAGAEFYRKSSAFNLGFYLNQIGLPGPPGAVLGVADLISGHGMFSAQITGPRHGILPYINIPITIANFEKDVKPHPTST